MVDEASIQLRYRALCPVLDERGRRLFAAAEAKSAGRGGVAAVARITGIARSTIIRGLAEIIAGSVDNPAAAVPATRVRRAGGGRKKLTQTDPTLLADLQELVAAATRGDPQAPLLWTSRSLRNLAAALQAMGHRISHHAVADLLRELNYSLQSNRKTREGTHNPDRDAQFVYINAKVAAALAAGEPAISVDTKKKELIGNYTAAGREWEPAGQPVRGEQQHDQHERRGLRKPARGSERFGDWPAGPALDRRPKSQPCARSADTAFSSPIARSSQPITCRGCRPRISAPVPASAQEKTA